MSTILSPEREQIYWLEEKYGAATLRLACYAAFALTITPKLLFYLRENAAEFDDRLLEEVPWHGPADLLLSPLCQRIGGNLYEMSPSLQAALLQQLQDEVKDGAGTIAKLEDFMLHYIAANLEGSKERSQQVAGQPQWVALALTRPGELADRIRKDLRQLLQNGQLDNEFYWVATIEAIQELVAEDYRQPLAESIVDDRLNLDDSTIDPNKLYEFDFTVVRVNEYGTTIAEETKTAKYFLEPLGEGLDAPRVEMVAIPGGSFLMGSPKGEGSNDERPQHLVTVSPFYMAKYPVTQAQWRSIALREDLKVAIDLKPDPAEFEGDNLPVEYVTWEEAREFCQRVTKLTQRQANGDLWEYRLPTEAQWEYACRAGTTTPFYFGETITTELANYDGNDTYGKEPKGQYRQQTTDVGSFPPNAFGLYDMHGNVWEWCADNWHSDYNGAPTDGSAWDNGNDNHSYVLRGGCWNYHPHFCRAAYRFSNTRDSAYYDIGFRLVVGGSGRTL
jgi:formylglycine-generating enzyme required for sulfatase activity